MGPAPSRRTRAPAPTRSAAAALLVLVAACGAAPDAGPAELRELWDGGRSFGAFLDSVDAREETWRANRARSAVPGPLLARARAATAPGWRLLVVAEDWCGDSVHTVPWVARLAEAVEGLEMRIVGSREGRDVMRAHPTPDGRAATPTVLLLDESFGERGCFVERPPGLQRWFLENPDDLSRAELLEEKYARYEADGGRSTLEEMVAVLEAAARGDARCRGAAGSAGEGAP